MDPLKPQRSLVCPDCGVTLDFVVTMDDKSKSPKVSIVLTPRAFDAAQQKATSPASLPPLSQDQPSPGPVLARCPCGASMTVDEAELTSVQTCPRCGTAYHVVIKREPETNQRVAVLVAKDAPARPKERMRTKTESPAPVESKTKAGAKRVQRASTQVRVPTSARHSPALGRARPKPGSRPPGRSGAGRSKAPPATPPGTQSALCPCGERHFVRRSDLGREISCRRCGKLLSFVEVRDPQTLAPSVKVKVISPGR